MTNTNALAPCPCPCCSGKPYSQCCQPYHDGAAAPDAKALMRSRYSAYALHLAPYIIATTHPDNGHYLEDKEQWTKQIDTFTDNTLFEKLEVFDFVDGKETATVTFTAHLKQEGRDATFTERSRFKKVDGRWLYVDGTFDQR